MSLPETGEVEVTTPADAAEVVEEVVEEIAEEGGDRLLIVLDIDGTVLLEDETLSPGVVEAVQDAGDAGHEVMIATGRSWAGTEKTLQALDIRPEYVVCSNGAVVMKREGDAYVRAHTETFDATQVLNLLREHLPNAKYMVEREDGERLYTDFIDDWNLSAAHRVPFEDLIGLPVSRVVVVSPGHDEEDFSRLVEDIGLNHVSYAIGWTAWLDIAPQGVDKGTALELVREWLDMPPADVLVIGDGRNDLGMFAWARRNGGRAIAMAQGPQEVLDAASETTASVQEGGVAAALRALSQR
ncbi:HAD family hydrolase [Micromonospora sp. DT81.3]|uniref:HAD family hydrolase n=1 Tax=Actinomycetes TaxID=1760 RepID=UPI003CE97B2A